MAIGAVYDANIFINFKYLTEISRYQYITKREKFHIARIASCEQFSLVPLEETMKKRTFWPCSTRSSTRRSITNDFVDFFEAWEFGKL